MIEGRLIGRRAILAGVAGACAAAGLGPSGAAATAAGGAARRVNVAGRQRMLTQRIARAVVFAALDVDAPRHLALLKASRDDFAAGLNGLRHGSLSLDLAPETDARAIRRCEEVTRLWAPFVARVDAALARGRPEPDEVAFVAEANGALLRASDVLVQAQVAAYGAAENDLARSVAVNVAGRQRMLTQRITKACGLLAYGWRPEETGAEIFEAVRLFQESHDALVGRRPEFGLGLPPARVLGKMIEVDALWQAFGPVVQTIALAGRVVPAQLGPLADLSDPLLARMDEAVTLYEIS